MSRKRPRVIGTTKEAIEKAEVATGFRFPSSYRNWLLLYNGLGIEGINIFPVFDERDPRMTWNSIVNEDEKAKSYWADVFDEDDDVSLNDLLAFADLGTGDYYCFDYSAPTEPEEYLIVLVSHETGIRSARAKSFSEFASLASTGAFDDD